MTKSEAITAIYTLFNAPHNADINIVYLNKVLDDLLAQPPQRTWVWLTWNDVPDEWVGKVEFMKGAKWAEAKSKEKNT